MEQDALPKQVRVGPMEISCLAWPADPDLPPEIAAGQFVEMVKSWHELTVASEFEASVAI